MMSAQNPCMMHVWMLVTSQSGHQAVGLVRVMLGNPTLKGTQSCYSLCTGKGAAVAGAAEDAAMGAESAGRQGRLSAHRPHHGQAVRRAASGVNDPLPCWHADDRHHAHQRSVLGRMRCLRALLLRTSVAGVC